MQNVYYVDYILLDKAILCIEQFEFRPWWSFNIIHLFQVHANYNMSKHDSLIIINLDCRWSIDNYNTKKENVKIEKTYQISG